MRFLSCFALILAAMVILIVASQMPWFRGPQTLAVPRSVPSGDQEIAWLHNPTSFESWDNFVWGVKRAEMAEGGKPSWLQVDDSAAFPNRTTAIPELVIRHQGYTGCLRIRWYKVTDEATQEAWVKALAARTTPPLVVVGGWSSDRAKELADAMRECHWPSFRPLLFLVTATADKVDPEDNNSSGDQGPSLISVYDQTFRFCFTNRQMANAVTDFVFSDATLRPGLIGWPGLQTLPTLAAGQWAATLTLAAETMLDWPPYPAFAIEWKDDPYSTDLSFKFREAFLRESCERTGLTRLQMEVNPVPFSTGRMNRPNAIEAEVAEHILNNLPPAGMRTVIIVPSVASPTRRMLRSLVQGNPAVGRRIVAITGDGLGVNTFFRDRDFSWPVRSLPISVASFVHADPFAWDTPGQEPLPPHGYEMEPPAPGGVRSSTEDIQLFTLLTRILSNGAFAGEAAQVVDTSESLANNLRSLKPAFFDPVGNRLSGNGEHIVVLRPFFPGEAPQPHLDALLQVYTHRPDSRAWQLIHTRPLGHNQAGQPE